jgi:integrase
MLAKIVFPRSAALHSAAHAQTTQDNYARGTRKFLHWCRENREDAHTPQDLDEVLNEFVHHCWESGESKSTAKCALFGSIKYLLGMGTPRSQFPMTRLALKGWDKLQPSQAWAPLTWDLTSVIAVHFVLRGRLDMAVGCLLAFDCLLRVGEMTALQRRDVAFDNDPRIGNDFKEAGLHLRHTKTGPHQYVVMTRPEVKALLRLYLRTRKRSALFDFDASQFRRVFRAICNDLGLDARYVPHSLRHGGATALFIATRDLSLVMVRGRWASKKSARHYVQDGCALLMDQRIPKRVAAAGRVFGADIGLALRRAVTQSGGGWL